jgi:hypothetical protein
MNAPARRLAYPDHEYERSHVQWVVRVKPSIEGQQREYSTSTSFVLFQLTVRPAGAARFDRYEDASAHARHLSFVYRLPFEVVARVRA